MLVGQKGLTELKAYLITTIPTWLAGLGGIIAGHFITIDGVTDLTRDEEIPKLRASIDNGMPLPLGLVSASSISDIRKQSSGCCLWIQIRPQL